MEKTQKRLPIGQNMIIPMKCINQRTEEALSAGCDLVLHCNGDLDEMSDVMAAAAPLTDDAMQRWQNAVEYIRDALPIDCSADVELLNELDLT